MASNSATATTSKPEATVEKFTTEPDLNNFPASIFSEVSFLEKKNQFFVQIALNDTDFTNLKLNASENTLVLRIQGKQGNTFIRIITLPVHVNIEQGKADYSGNILTICFPILSTSKEIEIQLK
ncbi:MAG TPA: Hsp20/alpha crystallin family protein [Anaerolineaceae bacterium]|nr:Hsp20/alpha crystallin family protein [Anaerolineaceae bacterium]